MSPAAESITLVETFPLGASVDEFAPIVGAVMKRLEVEGVAPLLSMQFYASSVPGEIGAVIRFSDRSKLREHIAMISSWAELARFSEMITLTELRVFGQLDPEIEAWMQQFKGRIVKHETLLAGFIRPS